MFLKILSLFKKKQKQIYPMQPKPLTLVFGNGDIGVSACYPADADPSDLDTLVLWNPHTRQPVGTELHVPEGTTTADIDVYVRMVFTNAASAQVVADALNKIIVAQVLKEGD